MVCNAPIAASFPAAPDLEAEEEAPETDPTGA
jgi:hypothetical protein